MKVLHCLLFTLMSISLFAQSVEREYGKLTTLEQEMTSYEEDPEAEAVILFDLGESKFVYREREGYNIQFKRHKRIKIFNKSAFEMAEIEIPYYVNGYGATENITAIEAVSYTMEDGRMVKTVLDPKTIYKEQATEQWHIKKFAIPNVQEGSIIEFRYIHETPFLSNLPDWNFQSRVPTLYSEYEVAMIPFYEYVFIAQGVTEFDYQNTRIDKTKRQWGTVINSRGTHTGNGVVFQDYVHTYGLSNVPAFKDESYITTVDDHIIKIDFQLAKINQPNGISKDIISTWPELNKRLLAHQGFGKYIKGSERQAKKLLGELKLDGKSEAAQLKTIIDYVKANFTWDGYSRKIAQQTPKQLLDTKAGTSAEINLFLIALLRQAGFEVEPFILSTRDHGRMNTAYPFDHYTNYVIAFVKWDVSFLADATDDQLPFDRIPLRCINGLGLIVNESAEGEWLNIGHDQPSTEKYTIATTIDAESLEAKHVLSVQTTEYDSYVYRSAFEDDNDDLKEAFTENIANISRVKTVNYNRPSSPYMMFFEGTSEIEALGGHLVVNPFLDLAISENRLTQEERTYPVDFTYPSATMFDIRLIIPEGYELDQLPKDIEHDDDLIRLIMKAKLDNRTVHIEAGYVFKKAVYEPVDYQKLKADIDAIVEAFQKEIVFTEEKT
ncbi:MAG: DUF3857 domain-containing protein [Bacteroidota bacterium]